MNRTIRLPFWSLFLLLLTALALVVACNGGGSNATLGDSDDDAGPPDDDNDADDDDNDDTGDDDNDSSPDDDDDDDDNDDDDVTPGWPYAEINSPANGSTLPGYSIHIDADIYEVTEVSKIRVTMDGADITSILTVTTTKVTGDLVATIGGDHTLRIDMENDQGAGHEISVFHINKPWVRIDAPQSGALLHMRDVTVDGAYGNCPNCDFQATLDGNDITGALDIWNGSIAGVLENLTDGEHELYFRFEPGGKADVAEVTVEFVVELLPPHFELSTSDTEITVGESVDVYYVFLDENGEDITGSLTVDLWVDPGNGVVIDGNHLTFYYPGLFAINVSTYYPPVGTVTAQTHVLVNATSALTLSLQLSSYEITAGESVVVTATVTDENGDPMPWATVVLSVDPPVGATIDGPVITLTNAGYIAIIGNVQGTDVYDIEHVTVNPAGPDTLLLSCEPPTIHVNESVTCAVAIEDEFGNVIEDETYYYQVAPNTGVVINGDIITFSFPGYFVVTATASDYPSVEEDVVVQVIDVETTPGVVITSPDRALYTNTSPVNVTGYVYNVDLLDPNTVVTLNGTPIYFDWQTGDFGPESYTLINGLNIIEVEVTAPGDKHGKASVSVMYALGEWPNDSWITDGIGFRATDLGLDQLEEVMLSYIDDLNIEEMIMSQNPVFDEEVEIWGLTIASAEANVTNVEYDQPTIEFDIQPQAIDTEGSLPYIRLDFDVHGSILGIGYSIDGYVELTNILLDTFTWVWLDQDTHTIQFSIDQFSVTIGDFNMDIDGFPDELEDWFEDDIRDLIEDAAQDALWAVVPPLLEQLLASIPMEFSYPVGDATFYFAGQPQTLTLDSDGMTVWMNGRVLTDTLNPGVRPLNGSVRTDSARPEMGSTVPNVGDPFGIGVVLGDDLINQLLYQTYRSGMLHMDVNDAFNACNPIIYLILPQICDAYQPNPGDPVWVDVKIRPQLPPVMVMNTGKAGTVETEIQLGDLFIYLYADTPGGPEVVLTLAASTKIPTEISHDYDTNTLNIEFGDITAVADAIDNPLDMPEGLFEDLAPLLIELLLPILDEALGGLELPAFEIGGDTYKLQVEHILVVGSGLDYIGIYGAVLPGTF